MKIGFTFCEFTLVSFSVRGTAIVVKVLMTLDSSLTLFMLLHTSCYECQEQMIASNPLCLKYRSYN